MKSPSVVSDLREEQARILLARWLTYGQWQEPADAPMQLIQQTADWLVESDTATRVADDTRARTFSP